MSKFKVGDIVEIDADEPRNAFLIKISTGIVPNEHYTITNVYVEAVDINKSLTGDDNGKGWYDYRFKLCKSAIVHNLLKDL